MAPKPSPSSPSLTPKKKGKGCLIGCLSAVGILIVLFVGLEVFRRYAVRRMDETFLQTYQPSPHIAEIAERTTMTDKAKKIFYRADPEFIQTDTFVQYCLERKGVELALACARSETPGEKKGSGPRIFLLQVEDPRFVDSKFPASAHELLHLVFHKLSSEEKVRLGLLLDAELERRQDDTNLLEIVDILKTAGSDKEAIYNEMHSVFGVEFRDISPELETYYAQYFTDRLQVVGMHETGGLETRIRKINQLSQETKALNAKLVGLNSQLTNLKNAGATDQFNSLVPQFNSLVNQYNAKVREGNKIYAEIEVFYKLINPDFQPPQEKS